MKLTEILLIGALIIVTLLLLKECSLNTELSKVQYKPVYSDLEQKKTKSGDNLVVIPSTDVDVRNLKNEIDSLKKELKLSKRTKVITNTSVISQTDTVLKTIPEYIYLENDTLLKLSHKDKWVELSATSSKYISEFTLKAVDTLSFTMTRTKKQTEVYISNASPYVKINQGYSLIVKEKKPWLSIGPHVGIDITGKPTVGISVQYPLIQFKR